MKSIRELQEKMLKPAICIGRGRKGEGCGYADGMGGDTCPNCGGMVITVAAKERLDKVLGEEP